MTRERGCAETEGERVKRWRHRERLGNRQMRGEGGGWMQISKDNERKRKKGEEDILPAYGPPV